MKPYKFRNLPCNCVSSKALHAVVGRQQTVHSSGGGVLEWCTSQSDAEAMLRVMKGYREFSGLRVVKWTDKT